MSLRTGDLRRRRRALSLVDEPGEASNSEIFWRDVRMELERCRRYDRRFALARFHIGGESSVERARFAGSFGNVLRLNEALLHDEPWLLVRLSEVTPRSADAAVARLQWAAQGRLEDLRSLVVFPDNGLTCRALIDALYTDRDESSLATPIWIAEERETRVTAPRSESA